MLVRLTKCTVKGHSAPKMKKNSQDDKYGSYMCAKGTQNLFFAFVWLFLKVDHTWNSGEIIKLSKNLV